MTHLENQPSSQFSNYLLRFIFLYIVLYIYPYGFEYIQELKPQSLDTISFWQGPTVWLGENILGWEMNEERLMKGFDSMYDYSRFVLIALLAALGSLIWVLIDSRLKRDYNENLKILTRTILRYHVGLTLIIYGLAKVFMLQFGEMDLIRLERATGNTNGMGFLWSFMSYSKFYTMTTGWIELIGGVLLLFRRTTFLGSFMLFISMVTVVLIDIGYDVRVKMFAIHLLLMTVLLLAPDLKRLFNFFVYNKPTKESVEHALFPHGKAKILRYTLKGLILLYFIMSCAIIYPDRIKKQTENQYESLTRFHKIETHIVNGYSISFSDPGRWKSIAINGSSYSPETMQLTVGESIYPKYYNFTADTLEHSITFVSMRGAKKDTFDMQYTDLGDNAFIFEGSSAKGDSIWIRTKSKTLEDYPLTANKIKWITDYKKK